MEERARSGAIKFFRTQSPRHFEGGDWDQGGSCPRHQPLTTEQVSCFPIVVSFNANFESLIIFSRSSMHHIMCVIAFEAWLSHLKVAALSNPLFFS